MRSIQGAERREKMIYSKEPVSGTHILRGTKPRSIGRYRDDDPHGREFYINAGLEYEICQNCTRKECSIYCNPLRKSRATNRENLEKIRDMALAGKTDREISAAIGRSESTICSIRNRNGIPSGTEIRSMAKKRKQLTDPCVGCYTKKKGKCSGSCKAKYAFVFERKKLEEKNC